MAVAPEGGVDRVHPVRAPGMGPPGLVWGDEDFRAHQSGDADVFDEVLVGDFLEHGERLSGL